jgi:membrane protein
MNWKAIYNLLKQTLTEWSEDNVPRMGAAMAYYTIFSIAPLLLIVIAIAGLVFGQEAAQGAIMEQIQGLVGPTGAQAIETMLANASKPSSGLMATVIGIVTLLAGATGVFGELQAALNTIWEAPERPSRGLLGFLRHRFLSLLMVIGMGFLLLVSLVLSAGLAALGSFYSDLLPIPEFVLQGLNFVISFAVITVLFAMMYKILPDVAIAWRDVWIGAALTAFLFTIGKGLIGLYLGKAGFSSAYGAAGSLVVILVWIYYSTQILLLGAEFSQVYAKTYGIAKRESAGPTATVGRSAVPDAHSSG